MSTIAYQGIDASDARPAACISTSVPDVDRQDFGLLIAYVIPGFIGLWGASFLSPTIAHWLSPEPSIPASIEAVFFVLVASAGTGMAASAFRWAILDTLNHFTGLTRPQWDDRRLQVNIDAFDTIVEAHYRHYLFYANSAVAAGFAFAAWSFTAHPPVPAFWPRALLFAAVEIVFLAAARDTLRKYYVRSRRLLGPNPEERR